MKVLIAIDSFKGSLSSSDGSRAIASGIREVYPEAEIVALPLADGGEGTVEALVQATGGRMIATTVTGPLQEETGAVYGILGDGRTAVIEVAAACGLPLVSTERRNPMFTTTYGVGELILDAIRQGCRNFVIGLGGSSTNDAGVGMLQALGFRFLDDREVEVGPGGQALSHIRKIGTSLVNPALQGCNFHVACDVSNPLYGPNGAAFVFGPQKGATREMVRELDNGLESFAHVVLKQFHMDMQGIPGAGAAGGMGAAFVGFLNAELKSGIGLVLDMIGLEDKLKGVDFVITGEGKLDEQTSMGKAPSGIARLAQKHGIPVIGLAGGIADDLSGINAAGITSCFSILNRPMTLEQAMEPGTAYENLKRVSLQLFRLIQALR